MGRRAYPAADPDSLAYPAGCRLWDSGLSGAHAVHRLGAVRVTPGRRAPTGLRTVALSL